MQIHNRNSEIDLENAFAATLVTTRDLQLVDQAKYMLLLLEETSADIGDEHEGDVEYDPTLARLTSTLYDSSEELREQSLSQY